MSTRLVEKLMDSFLISERFLNADSVRDAEKFEATTLQCATTNNYDKDMNEAGCEEVATGLVEAMEKGKEEPG